MKFYEREHDDFQGKPRRSKALATFSVVALCLIGFSAIAVAVAMSLINISGNGNIIFNAEDVYATVTGAITGTKTTNTLSQIDFDANTKSFDTPASWKNLVFDFTDDNEITFTITIKNKSTENSMYVEYTDSTSIENVNFTKKVGSEVKETMPVITIAPNVTQTITIVMNVISRESSVSGSFSFNVKLSTTDPSVGA